MYSEFAMCEVDYFRESFKYYKQKSKPEVLFSVIDFESKNLTESVIPANNVLSPSDNHDVNCLSCVKLGLQPHQTWNIYSLKGLNGFFYIKNPFTVHGQQMWIKKCLEVYPQKPAITNLDLHHQCVDDLLSLQIDDDPSRQNYIHKLRWATFGYHHNWDTKEYSQDHYCDFPECLTELSKHIAISLGFKTFIPEAAIVNYYNHKSTLGIHNDHSEEDYNEPIISISFGQTAIFLVGTNLKTDKPIPLFLRSGDIIILSDRSRLSYHAVPAIIQEPINNRYCISNYDDIWKPYHQYICNHRINISIRQVYHHST